MFSVIIPLYNKETFIARTLQSVLDQTFQEFEIIIVNDGSTDGSVKEVERFNDERIRLVEQTNAGVSAARNRGIEEAKYDTIAFLDADDEWLPNHLDELLHLKMKFPTCKILAVNYKIVDSEGKERFPIKTNLFDFNEMQGIMKNYFEVATKTAPPLWTSAVAVDKKSLQDVGGFPVGIRLGEDLLVWALLAMQNSIAYSKNITAIYNFKALTELIDDEPMPDENDVVGERLKSLLNTLSKKKPLCRYISLWHRMRYNLYIKNFHRSEAFNEILKALYYAPWLLKNYILLFLLFLPHSFRTILMRKRLKRQEKNIL